MNCLYWWFAVLGALLVSTQALPQSKDKLLTQLHNSIDQNRSKRITRHVNDSDEQIDIRQRMQPSIVDTQPATVWRPGQPRVRKPLNSTALTATNTPPKMQVYRDENGELQVRYLGARRTPGRPPVSSSTPRDTFVFPEDDYLSTTPARPNVPECAKGSTFCIDNDGYPKNLLDNLLEREYHRYEDLFTEDLVSTDLSQRNDVPGEESLCESTERIVYPRTALNKDNNWLVIVNHSNYTQGTRVEECRNTGSECSMKEVFPGGYVTECKQKFIYRTLLAINERKELVKDLFMLPSCCKCIYKQVNRRKK